MTGIYIHIPFCRSRCSYCGFVSSVNEFDSAAYIRALELEAAERLHGEIDTVYIGGGTPSVLPRGSFRSIFRAINDNAALAPDCEITVEANPDSCTDDFLEEIIGCGANRLSLGVQSLDNEVLARIGRQHTARQARDAVKRALEHGIGNVNCDLMIGLPGQTKGETENSAGEICQLGAKHISVYALSVEEGTAMYDSGYRPDEDAAADCYDAVLHKLVSCGMRRYEVSNFCRDGYMCRHNYKYWTREPYIGLGAAAHSFDGRRRTSNTSDIAEYIAGRRHEQGEDISGDEAAEEYIMLGMRTAEGIKFSAIDRLCGGDFAMEKKSIIDRLAADRLAEITDGGIRLCDDAFYVMNEVILRLISR